jgi:transcriptional regulator with XRE-family HTH domain
MCTELHERLKSARLRRGLSLAAIARKWGVREQNLKLIEDNAFEQLPTGLYGRNAVRSYASAVGMPADEALAEVADRLPTPEDPLDGLARVRGLSRRPHSDRSRAWAPPPAVLGRMAELGDAWRPQAALVLDALVLLTFDVALLQLTALVAGVQASEILRVAAPSMIALFALIAVLYLVLLGGIARATLGSWVAKVSIHMSTIDDVVRLLRLKRA